ncbi:MAG TPA: DUF5678 domain-containing protein [Desulfomonilia bacterium]|jgi:hypothetical protein
MKTEDSKHALIVDKKYEGKFVAMEGFTSRHVVAAGNDPERVMKAASKKGIAEPVIVFIPKGNITQIY